MKKIMFGCLCAVCAFIAAGNTPASRQIAEDLRSRQPLKKTPVSVCNTRVSAFLKEYFEIVQSEIIPTRKIPAITDEPMIWRFFVAPLRSMLTSLQLDEKEFVARAVMKINTEFDGAYVFSSGKNMGTFKAVGFPEDVGVFYRLEEYEGYSWTAHGRYPTNHTKGNFLRH